MLPRPGNDGERAEDEVDQHEGGGQQQQAEGGGQHCAPGIVELTQDNSSHATSWSVPMSQDVLLGRRVFETLF